jgi:hypothetical protein
MQEIKLKLRYIFLPFILLFIGILVIFSMVICYIGYDFSGIEKMLLGLFMTIIGIYFCLRPRLDLLRFRDERKKEAIYVFAIMSIFVTCFFLSSYWTSTLGKLTILEKISMIDDFPKTKFYQLKNQFVDVQNTQMYVDTTYYKGRLVHHCRFNTPIFDDSLAKKMPIAWIYNNMERTLEVDNEKELKNFITESQTKFEALDIAKFYYLEMTDNQSNNYLFDAKKIPFEHRNQSHIRDIISSFLIGSIFWFCLLLYYDLDYSKIKAN